jgi:hypothetical protein
MEFTVEEMNLMCVFDTPDRKTLIARMRESLPDADEEEMAALTRAVIGRLEGMSDAALAAVALAPDYEDDEETEV